MVPFAKLYADVHRLLYVYTTLKDVVQTYLSSLILASSKLPLRVWPGERKCGDSVPVA